MEDVTWQESREVQLQKALKNWAVIIGEWDPNVPFVQPVLAHDSINVQFMLLGDIFGNKVPSTLLKRANSIKRLAITWGSLACFFHVQNLCCAHSFAI